LAFDQPKSPRDGRQNEQFGGRKRIAVVGAGISGLSAAWLLGKTHDVTLYETNARIGGHANTVDATVNGCTFPVDTGFIVYNEANYPNLVALFDHLGVPTAPSDMSFGASLRGGACEYSGQTLQSVFATPRNLVSPRFWRMLIDVMRFHRSAKKALAAGLGDKETMGDFVQKNGLSTAFCEDFIGPMQAQSGQHLGRLFLFTPPGRLSSFTPITACYRF